MELVQERLERYANVANNEWKALVMLFSNPDRYEHYKEIKEGISDFRGGSPSHSTILKHLRYLTSKGFISEEDERYKCTEEGKEIGKPIAARSLYAADLSNIEPKNALGCSNSTTEFTAPAMRCLVLVHLSDEKEWEIVKLAETISQEGKRGFEHIIGCLSANILFLMEKSGLIEYIADLPYHSSGPLSRAEPFSYFRLIEKKEFPIFVDSHGYQELKTTKVVEDILNENSGRWLSVGEISKLAGLKSHWLSKALYFFYQKGYLEHKIGRPKVKITKKGLVWAEEVAIPIIKRAKNQIVENWQQRYESSIST